MSASARWLGHTDAVDVVPRYKFEAMVADALDDLPEGAAGGQPGDLDGEQRVGGGGLLPGLDRGHAGVDPL